MRIAINGHFMEMPGSGTGRYLRNLLRAIGRVDGVNDYIVLSPHEVEEPPDMPSSFTWRSVPVGRASRGGENIEKVFWEQHTFPSAARHEHARLMHVPHFAPPVRRQHMPTVVTIHDVIELRLPEYRTSPSAALYGQLVAKAAKGVDMVITVSEYAKRDIMEVLGIPSDRIRVVPLAPDSQFRRVLDAQRLAAIRAKYGLNERFVFYVGGLDVRKNVAGLVAAFAAVYHEIGDPRLQLLVSGKASQLGSSSVFPDWRPMVRTLGITDNVICEYIPDEDLPLVYSATSCFVYPSRYEGFGLPPLEAMACGAPVVCSERTSLPEVVGRAGILVDPDDTDALGGAIKRVLVSPEVRDDLRARALARSRQFGWDQVAVDTIAVYTEVGDAGH
jgi:glycosyltransferase involved in cell wall biosynthesis